MVNEKPLDTVEAELLRLERELPNRAFFIRTFVRVARMLDARLRAIETRHAAEQRPGDPRSKPS